MRPGRCLLVRSRRNQDVLRQIDYHRTRAAAARDVERVVHRARQVLAALHQVIVLGRRPGDAGGVGFLECIVADQMCRHLAGQAHQRHGIHQRIEQPGDRIGCTGTAGDQHATDAAGAARITLGRVHRRLLVTHQDVPDRRLLKQRVVDRQHGAARIAEHYLHTLFAQRTEQDLRTAFGAGDVG